MASPLGHYLAGLAVSQALARNETDRKRGILLAGAAMLPDLDFIPGILIGSSSHFHREATHTITAAVVVSLAAFAIFKWRRSGSAARYSLVFFLAYASHLLFDSVGRTGSGVPLLWPLTDERMRLPWQILPSIQHSDDPVFSMHNVKAAIWELALFVPMVGLGWAISMYHEAHRRWKPNLAILGFTTWLVMVVGGSYYWWSR